jgi:hypothetical protein
VRQRRNSNAVPEWRAVTLRRRQGTVHPCPNHHLVVPFSLRRFSLRSASVGSLAASISGQGTLLLSGPVTARLLSVAGRSELALLTIMASLSGLFGTAGLPTAVAYVVAPQRVPAGRVVQLIARTWLRLCLGAGTSSLTWLEAPLVAVSALQQRRRSSYSHASKESIVSEY